MKSAEARHVARLSRGLHHGAQDQHARERRERAEEDRDHHRTWDRETAQPLCDEHSNDDQHANDGLCDEQPRRGLAGKVSLEHGE